MVSISTRPEGDKQVSYFNAILSPKDQQQRLRKVQIIRENFAKQ